MELEVGGKKWTELKDENWGDHDPNTGRNALGEK
jgi:hypothetical protein